MKINQFLRQSPTYQTIIVGNSVQKSLDDFLEKTGLNWLQALVLLSLFFENESVRPKSAQSKEVRSKDEQPKGVQPKDLQATFATSKGNISHTISLLESKELLKRKTDRSDRRIFLLQITGRGKRMAARLVKKIDSLQNRVEAKVPERRLKRYLSDLNNQLEWHGW